MTDDPLLTWKGRRVRSPADSPETVAQKVPQALRPGSLFFVPAPLDGWGLDTLLARLPGDGAVVLLDLDAELAAHCQSAFVAFLGPAADDARVHRLAADSESAVQELFRVLPLSTLRRAEFLPLNGAWLPQAARYRQVFDRIESGLQRWWANRITEVHMGPLWTRNLVDNLAQTTHGSPWPRWGHDTVLVCGAGVTLESVVPWARQHRPNLRIVAADTALGVLRQANLVPDAVVCLEAQHANLRDFAGWAGADVQLFADLTSFPPATRVLARPPAWFISEFAPLSLWDRWPWPQVPRLPALGSVGVAAAWVAWHLSEGPVVLAGLDFSYPVGKTHARGAPALQALAARTHRLAPLEQGGSWVRPGVNALASGWLTSPVLASYGAVLADQAQAQSHRTWVWDRAGLDLGLSLWPRNQPPRRGPCGQSGPGVPEFRGWLDDEAQLWQAILDDFRAINAPPVEDSVWHRLEQRLKQVDYLTFWFPDPGFRRDTDWLVRAQVQVRWALSRLRRT